MGGRSSKSRTVYVNDPAQEQRHKEQMAMLQKQQAQLAEQARVREQEAQRQREAYIQQQRLTESCLAQTKQQLQTAMASHQQDLQETQRLRLRVDEEAKKLAEIQKQADATEKLLEEARKVSAECQAKIDEIDRERRELEEAQERRRAIEKARMETIGMLLTEYNIAFTGMTGIGKSTLLNGILRRRATHSAAALASTGRQGTMASAKYMILDTPIAVWDLPGGATREFPEATYCKDRCLDLFDHILLCSSGRFTTLDQSIILYAQEHSKPLTFVYTRADVDVTSLTRTGAAANRHEAYLKLRRDVSDSFHVNLAEIGYTTPYKILFVDSISYVENNAMNFDEMELFRTIVSNMSSRIECSDLSVDDLWARLGEQ